MVVKDNARFFCTLLSSLNNLLANVRRHLAVWDFVAEKDLVSWLDHLQHILSSDLCFHWSSCPGGFGDVDHLMDAVCGPDVDNDMRVLVKPGHQVAWVGLVAGVSGNSRSRSFPIMEASDSRSRTLGMDFFIPFPFPNFGNAFFSFPSRSRILGMDFFIPFPFPNFGNGLFQFPSRSRTLGMEFSIPVPVPEPSKVIPAHP